jgi:hypothetical protein
MLLFPARSRNRPTVVFDVDSRACDKPDVSNDSYDREEKIMLSLPPATRAIHTDAGNELNLSYYILVEENRDGLETYGVQVVENESGNSASVLGITMDGDMIESLVEMLERNAVTPVSLPDVLADWLV